jgi:hypothetical protein
MAQLGVACRDGMGQGETRQGLRTYTIPTAGRGPARRDMTRQDGSGPGWT